MLVEVVIGGAGLAATGIVLGRIARQLHRELQESEVSTRPKAPPPRPEKPVDLDAVIAEGHLAWEKHEARLFLANPLAWWLDPNRWGDDPDWRTRLLGEFGTTTPTGQWCEHCKEGRYTRRGDTRLCDRCGDYRTDPTPDVPTYDDKAPSCPGGCDSSAKIMAEHDGRPSLWECAVCSREYTLAGETKSSIKRRKKDRSGVVWGVPLPCGCASDTPIHVTAQPGLRFCRCKKCRKWWEPASNDPTGRRLAQGEHVHDYDDITPDAAAAWDRKAAKVRNGIETNHGSCPTCSFPVVKVDGGFYKCSNAKCHKYRSYWK